MRRNGVGAPLWTALAGIVTLVVACGGVVNNGGRGGQGAAAGSSDMFAGNSGSGGSGGGGSGGLTDDVGPSGGAARSTAAGGFTGGRSVEAGVSCRETNDAVHIDLRNDQGGDAGVPDGDVDLSLAGTMTSVTHTTFTFADCGFKNCVGTPWTARIDAPGLDLENILFEGDAVAVHYARRLPVAIAGGFSDETRDILVTDPLIHDADGGIVAASILVAADDGGGTLSGAPYRVSLVPAPCTDNGGSCFGQPLSASVEHDQGLLFVFGGVNDVLQMGDTTKWDVAGKETLMAGRNLRSFIVDSCNGTSRSTSAFWLSSTSECPGCL